VAEPPRDKIDGRRGNLRAGVVTVVRDGGVVAQLPGGAAARSPGAAGAAKALLAGTGGSFEGYRDRVGRRGSSGGGGEANAPRFLGALPILWNR
jgi:hypothetical protein